MPPEFAQPQARICTATDRLQDIEERISVLEECRLYGLLPAVRQSAARGRWSYLVDRLLSSQRRLLRGDIQHNRLQWRRMVWCLISYKDNGFRCWQTNLFCGSHSAMRQLCAPPGAKLEESRRQAQAPVRIANEFQVFITPKGKGQKWHAEYGCSGAVKPVTRGGIEVRRRDPCLKCVPTQVV